jgi:cardiolipin synthase
MVIFGCGSTPIQMAPDPRELQGPVEIKSTKGPLSKRAADRLVEEAVKDEAGADDLKRLLKAEQAVTEGSLVAGNRVELLVDAPAALDAMFRAMEQGRDHIHLETYILADDEVGQRLAEILLRQRRLGVEVRIVYDSIGSIQSSDAFLEMLRAGGIQLLEFHPIDFPELLDLQRLNIRNHRKLLIVDGKIAFTGGINISSAYARSPLGSRPEKRGQEWIKWRDTQVMIEGPAAAEFQKIFLRVWNEKATEETFGRISIHDKRYLPEAKEHGKELVRAVSAVPEENTYEIYNAYMTAISHARRRIWITQAYFVPDDKFTGALMEAAGRGVDVRLILPGISDHWIVQASSRARYRSLLEAGIRLCERSDALLHAKTAVIDGAWSTVGSSNLDYRSFLYANEANAIIIGTDFGAQMESLFLADLNESHEILLEEWKKRPVWKRIIEGIGLLFDRWL